MSSRTKKVIFIAALAVLFFWGAICLVIYQVVSNISGGPRRHYEQTTPFKFTHRQPNKGGPQRLPEGDPTGLADFSSNIPVLVLRSVSPGPVSDSQSYSAFTMEIFEPGGGQPVRLSNAPTVRARVGLRERGMLSRSFPKLSYRLKVQDQAGASVSLSLLGMPADSDWVLQGPWLDKSLIRNSFSYDLARAMGNAAMRTRPCEVFLNTSGRPVTESDYVGVYDLIEHVDRGKERINVTKLTPEENSEPAITGGYILAWDAGEGNFLPSWQPDYGRPASLQLRYPKNPSPAQIEWIDREFRRFDAAVRGPDSRDPVNGYAAYINVDAWVNYILFEELIFNLDAYDRSFYLQKDRGGKIQPGPVWDHDLALGHQLPRGTHFTGWWYSRRPRQNRWITQLARDPDFANKMARRWALLRQGPLSDGQIEARIDAFAAPLLSGAADRNFERWRILNDRIPPHKLRNITIATATYPEQITALKRFLRQRAAWMDGNLAAKTQLSSAAPN